MTMSNIPGFSLQKKKRSERCVAAATRLQHVAVAAVLPALALAVTAGHSSDFVQKQQPGLTYTPSLRQHSSSVTAKTMQVTGFNMTSYQRGGGSGSCICCIGRAIAVIS
jgi:hypothetical protein